MAQSGKGKEADNMQAYALTDVGKSRSVNQDYVYSSTSPLGSLDNLFLVADGMGGHNAGDYASRYTVENLVSFLSVKYPGKDIQSLLKEGIRQVNRELYYRSMEDENLSGMGSTLVAATIKARFFMWPMLETVVCICFGRSWSRLPGTILLWRSWLPLEK